MNVPPSMAIAQILMEDGIGADPGDGTAPAGPPWSTYVSLLPDKPDKVISVRDTGAMNDGREMRGAVVQHESVSIRVRCLDYLDGWQKGVEIQNALEAVNTRTVSTSAGSVVVRVFSRTSPLTYIGSQENKNGLSFVIVGNVTLEEP